MTEYSKIANFSGVYFDLGDVRESRKPATLKTNIGKTFIEKEIPLRNAVNIILSINGVITGLSQTSGQSQATAIENDRASLIALEDGYKRAYSDGKHSGDFVIVPNSLLFEDNADRSLGQPYKFTIELVEW